MSINGHLSRATTLRLLPVLLGALRKVFSLTVPTGAISICYWPCFGGRYWHGNRTQKGLSDSSLLKTNEFLSRLLVVSQTNPYYLQGIQDRHI